MAGIGEEGEARVPRQEVRVFPGCEACRTLLGHPDGGVRVYVVWGWSGLLLMFPPEMVAECQSSVGRLPYSYDPLEWIRFTG